MTGGSLDGQETDSLRQLTELVRTESSDGARLVSNLENNPICRVTLDATVPCLFVVWQSYATSAQLRFVHERVLELLKREHLSKILGDDSSLALIHIDDQAWIREDWLPRAAAAGLKAAASKWPYAFFGKQSVVNVQSGAPQGMALRSFGTLAEARNWLLAANG
jgi:hypothetical protein